MSNPYIVFFKKIIVLGIILIIMDITLGSMLEHFFLKMKSGEASRTTYSLNKADQEFLIFGSSRAVHHYIPDIFKDSLSYSSYYNTGTDGQNILYYYCLLKAILKRSKPKMIVLDINYNEFIQSEKKYEKLSYLLPYYKNHTEIRPVVNLRGPYEKIKTISNLYRYNSLLLAILANNLIKRKEEAFNGYVPLFGMWNKPLKEVDYHDDIKDIDTVKINYFKSFIQEAKNANCKVNVFVSPMLLIFKNKPISLKIASDICKNEQVNFTDNSQNSFFLQHPEFFKDASHLNNNGAIIYSKNISTIIKTQQ